MENSSTRRAALNPADDLVDDDAPTKVFARTSRPTPERAPPVYHDGLWDANDVARYLKVSRSWVYNRAESGLLPCFRVGGLLRFDAESVRTYARHGPSSPTHGFSGSRRGKVR
jgi:excisionase family DNA binding protein